MKALSLSFALVGALVASPVVAQDAEPVESVEPAEPVEACLRVTSSVPLADLDAVALGQLLVEGGVTVEILEPEACQTTDEGPDPTPEPTLQPESSPYVEFVAHGAGAAIELAALAERSEHAKGLDGLDRAARDLRKWARQQVKWLDRNPPEACYAHVHRQWRRGAVQVRDGAKAVRKSIRTLRPEPMRRAVRQLSAGATNLADVDLEEVTQVCIEAASGT